jgi:hypothetical protein
MGLYVKQSDTRSQLQEKLAQELQDRAREKAKQADLPDGVDDSAYIEGTTLSSKYGWVWIVVVAVIIAAAVIWLIAASSK